MFDKHVEKEENLNIQIIQKLNGICQEGDGIS